MLNEELKKLLVELNMSHHTESLEKVVVHSRQNFHEDIDLDQDEAALQRQIKAANKILKKRSTGRTVLYIVAAVAVAVALATKVTGWG